MGLFIIAGGLLLLGFKFKNLAENKNDDFDFPMIYSWFIAGLLLTICIGLTLNFNNQLNQIKSQYNSLKEQIEYAKVNNNDFERFYLIEDMKKINAQIKNHKIYHNNFWIGIWHSEEIGNLEYLK